MVAKRLLCTGILGAIMLCGPASRAQRPTYRGAHAIPENIGGKFCHIQVAHTHTYPPDDSLGPQFIERELEPGHFEFVGDPKDFGFQGLAHDYYGAHPMDYEGDDDEPTGLCARLEKHAHLRAPKEPQAYEERKGVYYFGSYREARRAARKVRRPWRSQRVADPARVSKAGTDNARKSRPLVKPTSSPPAPKPKVESAVADPHRSWMNRRLGH